MFPCPNCVFVATSVSTGASFGSGTGTVYVIDVGCTGTESRLIDCSNGGRIVGIHLPNHFNHARVVCASKCCSTYN